MYDDDIFPLGTVMPYELLYSRTIAGDGVVRYTDVPITDKSVMIEVLSLLSPFRRIAGYVYALRSDGITDYERVGGVTLPFGKNRVTFAAATLPYSLEFFPKWGVTSGIISVYVGEPGPPVPPLGAWRQMSVGPYQMRFDREFGVLLYRLSPSDEDVVSGTYGVASAVAVADDVYWKMASGQVYVRGIPPVEPIYLQTEQEWQAALSSPGAIIL